MNVNERLAVFNEGKERGKRETMQALLPFLKIARTQLVWRRTNDKTLTSGDRETLRTSILQAHNAITQIEELLVTSFG